MVSFYVCVPNQSGYAVEQLVSLEFFIYITLTAALMKWVPGGYRLSVRLHVLIFLKSGSFHRLELQGPSRLGGSTVIALHLRHIIKDKEDIILLTLWYIYLPTY